MRALGKLRAGAVAAFLSAGWIMTAVCAPPTMEDLLRRPVYASLVISPGGDYFAARVPIEDRTVLAIVRRADMRVTAQIDPGRDGFVDGELWVSDTRLFASTSMRFGTIAQPYSLDGLYSVDVDGSNRRRIAGSVVSDLRSDPSHVLISTCHKVVKNSCMSRLQRMRSDGVGGAEDIVDAPGVDARFLVDRQGRPVFSWGTDNDDVQTTYVRQGNAWTLVNDERTSGAEVIPVGVAHDGTSGYLWSERRSGADVLERIDLQTLERTVVASDPQRSPRSIAWSFDGSEPIGALFGTAVPRLTLFDRRHPHAALMQQMEAAFPGEWAQITSSSRDGRSVVVSVSSDREPLRYYLLDTPSGDLTLLARSRPWLDARAMAPTQAVEITARDGTVLDGLLTRPLEREGVATTSLVVMPHGGPFGVMDAWGFDDEVQMLAARGHSVLRVNFRGSGGRGRAFVEAGYREWGGKMQDDLTDATRWAHGQPGIDPRRTCIWGASYGGYAALMGAVREPSLYRCVVGVSGPYDLSTMYKWGDTQRSRWGRGVLKVTLGDDPTMLLERSPTRHAAAIKAKVMLVQGGRDPRVSPEHTRIMRRALDEAGVDYETYLPSNETHGFFSDKAKSEYYRRVMAFLAANLDSAN